MLYRARSYTGASYALARMLVAAGVVDQPMTIVVAGLPGVQTHHSLVELAQWAISEGAAGNIKRTRWEPYTGNQNAD